MKVVVIVTYSIVSRDRSALNSLTAYQIKVEKITACDSLVDHGSSWKILTFSDLVISLACAESRIMAFCYHNISNGRTENTNYYEKSLSEG